MSTSRMTGAPRQAANPATIGGFHVGAFVLAVAGPGPRLPGPLDYTLPRQPLPKLPIPDFEPVRSLPVEWDAAAELAPDAGPAVADVRTPSLRQRDSRLTALVDACYPAASRRSSEEGRVVIRVDVDATGRTSAWNLAEGSGFARLDAAVACVIRRLEFTPGRHDGAAVAASVMLPIVFRLH